MLGERAHLEGGVRTSTLVAVTACRVASVDASQFEHECSSGTVRGSPARRRRPRLTVRVHLCGVRGSTPAPGADFRPLRRAHLMRGDRPRRRGGAGADPRRRHRTAPGHARCWTACRSRARSCSLTCTGITCTGCRSSGPATAPDARVTLLLPEQDPAASAEVGAGPGHVPAALPDRARTACAATGRSARCQPGQLQGRGVHRRGPRDPAQGRPDLRLPGQRRARASVAYIPDHCPTDARARAGRAAASTTRPRWTWRRARTCSSTTRSCWPPRCPRRQSFGHAAAEYAVGLAARAGARRVGAVPPQAGPHRRRTGPAGRPVRGRPRPARRTIVGAEGEILDL